MWTVVNDKGMDRGASGGGWGGTSKAWARTGRGSRCEQMMKMRSRRSGGGQGGKTGGTSKRWRVKVR